MPAAPKFFITNLFDVFNLLTGEEVDSVCDSLSWGFEMEQVYELVDFYLAGSK